MNEIYKDQKKEKYSNRTLPVLLRDPKILLIGGGKVACQKAKILKANNIEFKIISSKIIDEIQAMNIILELKEFEISDLKNFNTVIDATGNSEVNSILKEAKKKKHFLLNIVDTPLECDFYFSSLLLYKNLKIAVSSDGGSPILTQIVRNKIKHVIPERIGDFAEKKFGERINSPQLKNITKTKEEAAKIFGKVFLVGCGPGDPDLLTLKALRIIQAAEIILHDSLLTTDILEFADKDAQIFCVGKQKGAHKFNQDEINNIMLEYVKEGHRVARLKGGDPYIFGRGAEEAEFLINNNIDVEIIPGISSAFAAPLLSGIPPTMRNISSGVSVVSAYTKDNNNNIEWINFLKIKNHTTIVLMGLTMVDKIFRRGSQLGVDKNLPAAIISNASTKKQKVITSTFENLLDLAKESERPAVLVFGEVVKLSGKLHKEKTSRIKEIIPDL